MQAHKYISAAILIIAVLHFIFVFPMIRVHHIGVFITGALTAAAMVLLIVLCHTITKNKHLNLLVHRLLTLVMGSLYNRTYLDLFCGIDQNISNQLNLKFEEKGAIMKYGIYFAYWTKEWQADYKYYIQKVKKLGFDVLEISCMALRSVYLRDEQLLDLKKCAEDHGIIMTAGYGPTKEQNLCSGDPAVVKRGMDFFKGLLPRLQLMDIKVLGGGLYSLLAIGSGGLRWTKKPT